LDEELATDAADRDAWLALARERGLLADGADEEATTIALHRLLGAAPSRLRCLALTDAVGERRTQNQPGTNDEYPNWRVPLGDPAGRVLFLEDVFTDPRAARLADVMRDL
jgi:4-alpha-glucanotransferase